MGVTIHHKLAASGRENVIKMLDRTQKLGTKMQLEAVRTGIPFEIIRKSKTCLMFNIGQCETLDFDFRTAKEWRDEAGDRFYYDYFLKAFGERRPVKTSLEVVLDEGYRVDEFPQNLKFYASGFCKTQFAGSLVEHKYVAELIRSVAMYCEKAHVLDEGHYYHTGMIEDASSAISRLGQMIDGLAGTFSSLGYDCKKGGITTIKDMKKK